MKKWIAFIQSTLEHYYPDPKPPLNFYSPFTCLIAVLLSAQCTDLRVNQVIPHLFALADTPQRMQELEIETIEKTIRPCGLAPKKSTAIHRLSQLLCERYGGRVPRTIETLIKLPGVGRKTASVVCAQAFGKETFPVDTHILRLSHRWGLSAHERADLCEKDLRRCFAKTTWSKVHLQMIFFGREYCPARGHKVDQCPICCEKKQFLQTNLRKTL